MSTAPVRSRSAFWSRAIARAILVVAFTAYAAAKFAGVQFVTAGGLLDRPVADLSGIDLTWVYFGRSPLYANFVAVGQLVAAALLAFDRTARLGAAVLLPITANIVAVNFGFRIGTDTAIASSVLLALNLYLLAGDLPAWKRVFWDETAADPTRPAGHPRHAAAVAKGVSVLALLAGAYALFVTQGAPDGGTPPVSGEWRVESASVNGLPTADPALGAGWRWVCFEPDGRVSVRTNRWTFLGRYDAAASGDGFVIRYDPEPIPPVYPGEALPDRLSPAEQRRMLGPQLADFRWPVELTGTFRKDGGRLIVTAGRGAEKVEWVLAPYMRPKF